MAGYHLANPTPAWSGHIVANLEKILTKGGLEEIQEKFSRESLSAAEKISRWTNFYRQIFGIRTNFPNLMVAAEIDVIAVTNQIAEAEICEKLSAILSVHRKYSFSKTSSRPDRDYLVAFAPNSQKGISLKEELLLRLKQYYEGGYIDTETTTVCLGTSFQNGKHPHVAVHEKMLAIDDCDILGDSHTLRYPKISF